jgi:hypothetical protein
MKLTKSELKNLIKECIVEIFQESFSSKSDDFKKSVDKEKPKVSNKQQIESFINNRPKSLLEEMLADTAQTTLRSQNSAEKNPRSSINYTDKISQFVDQSSPEDIFGSENAEKWEKLAFFDKKNK